MSKGAANPHCGAFHIGLMAAISSFSELPEICYQRLALFGSWGTIEVNAVCGGYRRNHARELDRLYLLKELDIVIDDVFECRATIVMEVRRGLSNAVQSRNIEFVPVVERRRPTDETCQERASDRTGAPHLRAVREREFIGAHLVGEAGRARREHEPRRDGIGRSGTSRAMSWNRATIGGDVVDWPGPPWHCAHARMKTALPCCSSAVRGGSGSGRGVIPLLTASESARTPGLLNRVNWNTARSSRVCRVGVLCIWAWLIKAASA